MKVIPYTKEYEHLTKDFSCGNIVIDNFIKSSEALDDSIAKTYIMLSDDNNYLIGYYSLTTGTYDIIDNGVRIKQCGSIHISYFAITSMFQGVITYSDDEHIYKFSDVLLMDCLDRIESLKEFIGFGCVTLSSTEQGFNLYSRLGFEKIDEDFCFSDTDAEKKSVDMYYMFEM